MTFTEAAVEVLRLAGKPLHYKKITEIAIEKNLLSHVGKTPEITMSSRLATMVKKDRGDAPIVKIKPGVFGLREFPEDILESAKDDSGHDFKLEDAAEAAPSDAAETVADESAEGDDPKGDEKAEATEEKKKPARKLPGADVFPEEDDDDEPILANLDDETKEGEDGDGKRRKRRRRRRTRKDEDESSDSAEERPERPERQERSGRRNRRGGSESGGRGRGRGRDSGRDSGRSGRSIPDGDWERLASETDAVGSDLANAIENALGGRGRQAKSPGRIAESLVKNGRLSGDASTLAPTIAAAVRSDQAAREALGLRPRFRIVDGWVALTAWGLPGEAVRAEADAVKAVTRQRQQVLRAFIRALGDLPAAGFMEILASWLNSEGIQGLRAVRRNGNKSSDFHLAGTLVRGPVELPIALVVSRNGGAVTRDRVVEVRGALHHYGDAREAWVISLGQVGRDAREEAGGKGAAPVALFDGMALATAMEAKGIGLRRYSLPIVGLDEDLLETLRGPGRARNRDEEEPKAEAKGETEESKSSEAPEGSAEEGSSEERPAEEELSSDEPTGDESVTPEGDESEPEEEAAAEAVAEDEESTDDDDKGDDDDADDDDKSDGDDDADDDDAEILGAKSDDEDDGDDEKD